MTEKLLNCPFCGGEARMMRERAIRNLIEGANNG
jgi:hypothetical protein